MWNFSRAFKASFISNFYPCNSLKIVIFNLHLYLVSVFQMISSDVYMNLLEGAMEFQRKRKGHPKHMRHNGSKAIPFSSHLGFLNCCLGSPVLAELEDYWLQHAMPCYGRIYIEIVCFHGNL